MTRDARLYILRDKDWKPLADIFIGHSDYLLQNDVTIFQFGSISYSYAILSLSADADNLIEGYGAELAVEKDYMRNALHENSYPVLFGEKENLVFLDKFK